MESIFSDLLKNYDCISCFTLITHNEILSSFLLFAFYNVFPHSSRPYKKRIENHWHQLFSQTENMSIIAPLTQYSATSANAWQFLW